MQTKSDREVAIEALVAKFREQLETQLPDEALTLDQIEDLAGVIGSEVKTEVREQMREVQQGKG